MVSTPTGRIRFSQEAPSRSKRIPSPKPLLGFAQKSKGRAEKHFKVG